MVNQLEYGIQQCSLRNQYFTREKKSLDPNWTMCSLSTDAFNNVDSCRKLVDLTLLELIYQ